MIAIFGDVRIFQPFPSHFPSSYLGSKTVLADPPRDNRPPPAIKQRRIAGIVFEAVEGWVSAGPATQPGPCRAVTHQSVGRLLRLGSIIIRGFFPVAQPLSWLPREDGMRPCTPCYAHVAVPPPLASNVPAIGLGLVFSLGTPLAALGLVARDLARPWPPLLLGRVVAHFLCTCARRAARGHRRIGSFFWAVDWPEVVGASGRSFVGG